MTTLSYLSGFGVAALDSIPVQQPTSGEFAPGFTRTVDDWISVAAAGLSQYSTFRLCRFPVDAKLKSVVVATDTPPDSNSVQQLAFFCDVAFSDSTMDGTPLSYQGQIPTTAGYGTGNPANHAVAAATVTAPKPGAYSTPNNLFGTLTMSGNNIAIPPVDLMWTLTATGLTTSTPAAGCGGYTAAQIQTVPLWQVFGFQDGNGNPRSPGGFFDLLFTVKTVAATAAAYNFYAKVSYVL